MSARKTRSAATGQSRQLRSNDPAADYLEDGTEGIDDLTRSAFPTVETVVEEDEEEELDEARPEVGGFANPTVGVNPVAAKGAFPDYDEGTDDDDEYSETAIDGLCLGALQGHHCMVPIIHQDGTMCYCGSPLTGCKEHTASQKSTSDLRGKSGEYLVKRRDDGKGLKYDFIPVSFVSPEESCEQAEETKKHMAQQGQAAVRTAKTPETGMTAAWNQLNKFRTSFTSPAKESQQATTPRTGNTTPKRAPAPSRKPPAKESQPAKTPRTSTAAPKRAPEPLGSVMQLEVQRMEDELQDAHKAIADMREQMITMSQQAALTKAQAKKAPRPGRPTTKRA